jgi:hypothetical protein
MKRLLILALVAGCFAAPLPARATCGATVPYIFVNNVTIVDATTTNTNNAFLLGCASTVDNTQIGPNGIYASQIIPTNSGQAQFGGSVNYTFPVGLSMPGAFAAGTCSLPSNAGDGSFCRSNTTGQISLGGQTLDYGLGTSGSFTFSQAVLATPISATAASYLGTFYYNTGTGVHAPLSTFHHDFGTFSSVTSGSCTAGFICTLTGSGTIALSPAFSDTNFVCVITPNTGTGTTGALFFAMYHGRTASSVNLDVVSGTQGIGNGVTVIVDYDCFGPST